MVNAALSAPTVSARTVSCRPPYLSDPEQQDGLDPQRFTLLNWNGQVTTKSGKKKVYDTDPHTSLRRRFLLSAAGFLPIESQL